MIETQKPDYICQCGVQKLHASGFEPFSPCIACGKPDRRSTAPFDPEPRELCPDPQLGTREGWEWCAECAGIQPPGHVCRDPIVMMCAEELRALIRQMRSED